MKPLFDEEDRRASVFADPQLLFQDKSWVDGKGHLCWISSMDVTHVSSVINFMRRHSDKILISYFSAKHADLAFCQYDDQEYAVNQAWGGSHFEWDAAPRFGNPEWLEHTPLVKALRKRIEDSWCIDEILAVAPVRGSGQD